MSRLQTFFRQRSSGTLKDICRETRWIYRHTRAYRRAVFAYTLLGLLSTALSMLAALAARELVNSMLRLGTVQKEGRHIAVLGVTLVLITAGEILLHALINRYSAKTELRISNELRAEVFSKLLNTEWEALQEYHSGDLLSRLNTDVSTVAGSVLGWLPTLLIQLAKFLASLIVIVCFDPTMALLALLTAPITLLAARPFVKKMRELSKQMRVVGGEMMAFHEEALQNAQSIKAFNIVPAFLDRLYRKQDEYYHTAMALNRFSVSNSVLLSSCSQLIRYLCLAYGVFRLWCGAIDLGTMVLFLQLAGYLSAALTALIRLIPSVVSCTVAAQRLMTVLELPRETLDQSALEFSGAPLTLQLQDLTFAYRSREPVLKSLTLCVQPHELIAIVGASGSGKTTLFRLLLGLLHPSFGSAELLSGQTRLPLSPSTRAFFSYVPQENVIFSGTVAELLRLSHPDATEDALYAALRAACAEEFVRALPSALHSPLQERGSSLSEGQKQRLAIARAILADAPILLLDEATSALDPETERQVLENIAALRGKTCIFCTHRLSVLPLCSSVYRLQDGHLEQLSDQERSQLVSSI